MQEKTPEFAPLFSIYRNIFDLTGKYTISAEDALNRIKTGKSAKQVEIIRNEQDENRQQNLKKYLPCVCFSGTFAKREDSGLLTHSGLICLDFDDVEVEDAISQFRKWSYTFACWVSPRGNGVKVLVRIANPQKHREHFLSLKKHLPEADPSGINVSRVCYESYDPDLYYNPNSLVWTECINVEFLPTGIAKETDKIYQSLKKWAENSKGGFKSGNRNMFVFLLSGALCRAGVSQQEAVRIIVSDYAQKGFDEKEIERTIRSAYRANKQKEGTVQFTFNEKHEIIYEVNPDVILTGMKPDDVIYGSDVIEGALDVFDNGYRLAETTFIPALDEYFKWKRGELTLLSGIGNYGKTNYLMYLCVVKSYYTGSKWAIFSPEHYPAHEFYHDLAEMLLGCAAHAGAWSKPSREAYLNAYEFVSGHFFYIYPETISPTPEYIKTKFTELILKEKVDGVIIDPFNQLTNDYASAGGRTDKYLETFLSDIKQFGQKNNVYTILVAHPHKLKKLDTGNYPCPDVFDLADGAMWNNKCDNIIIYHRPNAQTDPDSPVCEHHSKKIKRQKMVGKRGHIEMAYDRSLRRFVFSGMDALKGNRYQHGGSENLNSGSLGESNPF